MRCRLLVLAGLCCLLPAQPSAPIEKGSFTIHMMLHAIGEEHYEIAGGLDGARILTASAEYSDRRMKRTTTATIRMTPRRRRSGVLRQKPHDQFGDH